MADGVVGVRQATTPDRQIDNAVLTNDVGATVYRQKVVASDSLGQSFSAFPAGFVRTTDEPRQLFYDTFDAALDTTNVWAVGNGGGGVAGAVSAGRLTLGTGTTANGYAFVGSIATFKPTIPAWLGYSFANKVEAGTPAANSCRYWGSGTAPASPTSAIPVTDGAGFEIATDGKMYAVVYAAGVRTQIADLSAATGTGVQPTDGAYHRYAIYYRTDKTYFYIDSLNTPVATANFATPQIQTLPLRMLVIAGPTAPASSAVLDCTGAVVWDTGKNTTKMVDATYPWRGAKIGASGSQLVAVEAVTAWKSTQQTVGTAAVQIASTPLVGRKTITLKNHPSNSPTGAIIYVGLAGVTTATGFPLAVGDSIDIELADVNAANVVVPVYAIASNAGQTLAIIEAG